MTRSTVPSKLLTLGPPTHLCSCPDHGGASNVDVLHAILERRSAGGRDGLVERVQVAHDDVNCAWATQGEG